MITLLELVDQFSKWSGIHLYVNKCNIIAFIHDLKAILRKRNRDDALQAKLVHVNLAGCPVGSLTKDEALPGGYLGSVLTTSLCPDTHLNWTNDQLNMIGKALARTLLPPQIIQRLLVLYGAPSKITHTQCLMALSPQAIKEVDSFQKNSLLGFGASLSPFRGRDSTPP